MGYTYWYKPRFRHPGRYAFPMNDKRYIMVEANVGLPQVYNPYEVTTPQSVPSLQSARLRVTRLVVYPSVKPPVNYYVDPLMAPKPLPNQTIINKPTKTGTPTFNITNQPPTNWCWRSIYGAQSQ